jgi:phospholipase C
MKKSTSMVLALVVIPLILVSSSIPLSNAVATPTDASSNSSSSTSTPIKYLVVIFQENTPFDHYFATYPHATNSSSTQPHFSSLYNTPTVNGITTGTGLSTNNTNLANPFHLDRSDSVKVALCDPNHDYTSRQKSYNGGLMDKFVQSSG